MPTKTTTVRGIARGACIDLSLEDVALAREVAQARSRENRANGVQDRADNAATSARMEVVGALGEVAFLRMLYADPRWHMLEKPGATTCRSSRHGTDADYDYKGTVDVKTRGESDPPYCLRSDPGKTAPLFAQMWIVGGLPARPPTAEPLRMMFCGACRHELLYIDVHYEVGWKNHPQYVAPIALLDDLSLEVDPRTLTLMPKEPMEPVRPSEALHAAKKAAAAAATAARFGAS
jgi:hypothetical protein